MSRCVRWLLGVAIVVAGLCAASPASAAGPASFGNHVHRMTVQGLQWWMPIVKPRPEGPTPEWIRKQTLANGERYITPALKEQEEKILGAEERMAALEATLFAELVHEVGSFGPSLARLADAIARLDAVGTLATVAGESDAPPLRLSARA